MAQNKDIEFKMDADDMVKALDNTIVAFGQFAMAIDELSKVIGQLKLIEAKPKLTRWQRIKKRFRGRGR